MTSDVIIFILSSVMFGCSLFLVAYLANKTQKLIIEISDIKKSLINLSENTVEKVNTDLYEIKLMKDTILGNVVQSYKTPIAPAEVRRTVKVTPAQIRTGINNLNKHREKQLALKQEKLKQEAERKNERKYKNPPEIREVNKLKAREYRDKLKKMGQQRADPQETDNIIAYVND